MMQNSPGSGGAAAGVVTSGKYLSKRQRLLESDDEELLM
jgi:hypothetical protein